MIAEHNWQWSEVILMDKNHGEEPGARNGLELRIDNQARVSPFHGETSEPGIQ